MKFIKQFILLAAFLPMPLFADVWNVQVGAFSSRAEAEKLKQRLGQKEIPDVFVKQEEPWFRVYAGPFERFVDAQLVKDALKTRFQTDSFIKKAVEAEGSSFVNPLDICGKFFKKTDLQPAASLAGDEEYKRLEALDTAKNKEQYLAEITRAKQTVAQGSALRGYVDVNLAIGKIIEKKYDEALALLKPVADGDVVAAKVHRVMAMRRVAWITHRQGDRLGAYRAYRDLENYSDSPKVKALCQVECAGLMMELAESGKGTHEEVRAEIARALTEIPESEIQHRATLELMNSETYFRQPEKDIKTAAELSENLYERLKALGDKAPKREMVTALRQAGYFRIKNHDKDLALDHYEELFRDFEVGTDHFEGLDPHVLGLYDLSYLAAGEGDRKAYNDMKKTIIENFPEEFVAKKLAKQYPHLVAEIEREKQEEEK